MNLRFFSILSEREVKIDNYKISEQNKDRALDV